MTIQEAIKSGRPFTRPDKYLYYSCWEGYIVYEGTKDIVQFGVTFDDLYVDDLLADDWRIKE